MRSFGTAFCVRQRAQPSEHSDRNRPSGGRRSRPRSVSSPCGFSPSGEEGPAAPEPAGIPGPPAAKMFNRGYWLVVVAEVVLLFGGIAVLRAWERPEETNVAWIAFVVGVHFIALAPAWRQRSIILPGVILSPVRCRRARPVGDIRRRMGALRQRRAVRRNPPGGLHLFRPARSVVPLRTGPGRRRRWRRPHQLITGLALRPSEVTASRPSASCAGHRRRRSRLSCPRRGWT